MGKQIPLVIYKGGVRTVIGMASVEEDGSFVGQVAKDHWPTVKDLFLPNIGEFSIAPVGTRSTRRGVHIENNPEDKVLSKIHAPVPNHDI